jgi:hypothetical protein
MLSNNTWGINPYDQIPIPAMAAGENDVFVAWRYTANSTASDHANFIAASYDGGKSFTKPIAIGGGMDMMDVPMLAAAKHGVFILWQESNSRTVDTWIARGTIPEGYVQAGNPGAQETLQHQPAGPGYSLFAMIAVAGGTAAAIAYVVKRRGAAK